MFVIFAFSLMSSLIGEGASQSVVSFKMTVIDSPVD